MAGDYIQLTRTLWTIARTKLAGQSQSRRSADQLTAQPSQHLPPLIPPALMPALPGRRSVLHRAVNKVERRTYGRARPAAYAKVASTRRVDGILREIVHRRGGNTDAVRANLDLVVDVGEQNDLDYFVVPESDQPRTRVGVVSSEWDRFVDGLVSRGRTWPVYVQIHARDAGGELRTHIDLVARPEIERAVRAQDHVEVFGMYAPTSHTRPWAEAAACVVERWRDDPSTGALTAVRPNRRTPYVSGRYREPIRQLRAGREVRTLQAFAQPDIFDVTFPIDVVYTWVDNADPQWLVRKQDAEKSLGIARHPGTSAPRFNNHDELRYSLRSLEQFAPWVRNIYLVTDRQTPAWLHPDQDRITVVDHRDIFPADALPTFNSHSIEARLHLVEGLSEHFLYLNDDCFLGQPVHPGQFFDSNGVAKFFLAKRLTLGFAGAGEAPVHDQARRNTVDLLERDFGVTAGRAFQHTPIALRRSVLVELDERYPAEFETTWRSRFRDGGDYQITSWLHHYYGYLTGRARPAKIRYVYLDPSQSRYRSTMKELLGRRHAEVFCINENLKAHSPRQIERTEAWLKRYYPQPASFEMADRA